MWDNLWFAAFKYFTMKFWLLVVNIKSPMLKFDSISIII